MCDPTFEVILQPDFEQALYDARHGGYAQRSWVVFELHVSNFRDGTADFFTHPLTRSSQQTPADRR